MSEEGVMQKIDPFQIIINEHFLFLIILAKKLKMSFFAFIRMYLFYK